MRSRMLVTGAAIASLALAAAPAAAAKVTFEGTVEGQGLDADFTLTAGKKRVCTDLDENRGNVIDEVRFKARGDDGSESFSNAGTVQPRFCARDKKFAKAARDVKKIKAKAFGSYAEVGNGTLRKD